MTDDTFFENVAELIDQPELKAEIVDGKFIIEPADAGIALLGYIQINDMQLDEYHKEQEKLLVELDFIRDDNAKLRDFLDRIYGVLMDYENFELADELMSLMYPVKGIQKLDDTSTENSEENL